VRTAVLLVALVACRSPSATGDDDDATTTDARGSGSGSGSQATGAFDPAITKVIIEIDYEAGQEPYTGNIIGFGNTFDPTVANINRLFANKKQLTIPTTTAQMESIGSVNDEQLTGADILTLASLHRTQKDTADTKTYYVVFVSGFYTDGSGTHTNVLGVSLGGSSVVAMFKDVIRGTQSITTPNTERYVEQSTLIHEIAHAIGLVDNGVAMAAPHKDDPHGAHCTNPDCVMYWLNEGASDATSFALSRLVTGNSLLFDNACLADVDAKSGGL
jgi:hypothetical protein